MFKDYVLLAYIAIMCTPLLWFVRPHKIPGNVKWYYGHVIVVIISLIGLATYRYNYPSVL